MPRHLFLVCLALGIASACSGPAAPGREPDVAPLVGTWTGTVSLEDQEGTAVLVLTRPTPSAAGTWEWDVPGLAWRGRGSVYVTEDAPARVSLVFESDAPLVCVDGSRWTAFLADLARDGDRLTGTWYRFVSPCRQGTLRLRRAR